MNDHRWSDALLDHSACSEAIDWAATQPNLPTAWAVCQRGDWMLWLAAQCCQPGDDLHRSVVRAAAEIAGTVGHLVPADEPRPAAALAAALAWADYPSEDRRDAARAARDAAWAAAGAAGAAAWAAARAAAGAAGAAGAAWAAEAAAGAAWDAAWAAAGAAGVISLSASADIVRRHIPDAPGWGENEISRASSQRMGHFRPGP